MRWSTQALEKLSPEEFGEAFAVAIKAGERWRPPDHPGEHAGARHRSPVADTPYHRAAFALQSLYGGDQPRSRSAMYRFRAVMELYLEGALTQWVAPGQADERARTPSTPSSPKAGGGVGRIHPAVLHVASQMRLSKNGKFPKRKFLEAVAQTAQATYTELNQGWSVDGSHSGNVEDPNARD